MLDLAVVLLEEEMIRQMVEHHWIGRIVRVRLGQHLHSLSNGIWRFLIQLEQRKSHQGADALAVQTERAIKCKSRLVQLAELVEAMTHPESHIGWTEWICA